MPLFRVAGLAKQGDDETAGLVREVQRLAGNLSQIPRSAEGRPHPEIGAAARSFQRINEHLESGWKAGQLGARREAALAREFHKIGAALESSHKAAVKKTAGRKTTKKRR